MANDVASGVKAIEVEAERILEDARAKADEILLKAKEKSKAIQDSELPMDEVKAECDGITRRARQQADAELSNSEKRASEIGASASKKIDQFAKLIVSIVTGEKSA